MADGPVGASHLRPGPRWNACSYGLDAEVAPAVPMLDCYIVSVLARAHGVGCYRTQFEFFLFSVHNILGLCPLIMKVISGNCRKYEKRKEGNKSHP